MNDGNAGSVDEVESARYKFVVFLALAILIGILALVCSLSHGYELQERLQLPPGRASVEASPLVTARLESAVP